MGEAPRTVRRMLAPLISPTTYRRGLYLLLGGVLALPYLLLAGVFAAMVADDSSSRAVIAIMVVVSAVIGTAPAFLGGTRALQIAAVRWLLGVDLPDPPTAAAEPVRLSRETRLRAALWFVVHLVVGAGVALVLVTAVPLASAFLTARFAPADSGLTGLPLGPFAGRPALLSIAGLALLVASAYAVAGLGALASLMAPVLLGPSPTERIAALEARARRLAEHNEVARELHDSVGHALTVTVLQAAAAGQLLDTDPAFVRRALAAIEDSGRAAMTDLDQVLGLLRDREPPPHRPQRTLADLDRLVAEARSTGRSVELTTVGDIDAVPAVVSRQGYRIVQEGLTNALRHAGPVPVTLRVEVGQGSLTIAARNPVPRSRPVAGAQRAAAVTTSGSGIDGMRERVHLLGGRLTVGGRDGEWRIAAHLPLAAGGST